MNDIIIADQALTQVNTLHNGKKIDSARLMFSFHSRVQRKSATCTSPKVIKTWDKFAQPLLDIHCLFQYQGSTSPEE